MRNRINTTIHVLIMLLILVPLTLNGQGSGGDLLNETPLVPLPPGMTWDEYRDMNRRVTLGLVLSSIPIPGSMHSYAGEKRTAKIIMYSAAAGAASMLLGMSMLDQDDFPETDFDILSINSGDDEHRYVKIPVEITGKDTTYRLQEIFRKQSGGGGLLILIGGAVLITDYLYDFLHGIKIIEEKRDRVRYKYGQRLGLSVTPSMDSSIRAPGLQLSFAL